MRAIGALAVATLLAACASSGAFPELGNPNTAITAAQDQVFQAKQAGADSLAPAPLDSAEHYLELAQRQQRDGDPKRAALSARQATADALYARAQSDRVRAEREQLRAQGALEALPPQ